MKRYYHAVYIINIGDSAVQIITATADFTGRITPNTIKALEADMKARQPDARSVQLLNLIRIRKAKR
jgi:hypothetical protein